MKKPRTYTAPKSRPDGLPDPLLWAGWTATRQAQHLRQVADHCDGVNATQAAWLRKWATAIEAEAKA